MKTKIHMQDQMVNKVEAIMLHDQLQQLVFLLTKVLPMVLLTRLVHINLKTAK